MLSETLLALVIAVQVYIPPSCDVKFPMVAILSSHCALMVHTSLGPAPDHTLHCMAYAMLASTVHVSVTMVPGRAVM